MTAKDVNSGLTAERLREVVTYDPATGVLRWRIARGRAKVGAVAGSPEKKGYLRISIDGRRFKAHRLAWLYVKAEWPTDQIDHENGHHADNRFDNLREANNPLNCANAAVPKNNTVGFKGVAKSGRRFTAGIKKNYRRIHLGSFDTAQEAAAAYDAKAKELWGNFARPNGRKAA